VKVSKQMKEHYSIVIAFTWEKQPVCNRYGTGLQFLLLYDSEGSSSTHSAEKLSADKKSSEDSKKEESKCRITFHYGPFQGAVR